MARDYNKVKYIATSPWWLLEKHLEMCALAMAG